jgi:uncharacterized protein YigE (DUF2233 family)
VTRAAALIAFLLAWPSVLAANTVSCSAEVFEGNRLTVCRVDAQEADLRLFLRDAGGKILGQFDAVQDGLKDGQSLVFAMNGGMYHPNRKPVGYYVENGKAEQRLYPNAGPGNFGLVPNGVFCIREGRADVIESKTFEANPVACSYATQSGPMLVIDGALHPKFLPQSTSKFIRNGVGTSTDGHQAIFVKSENAVNFHSFARYFRDVLKLPQALFLDGKISRLHAPEINRSDPGFWMGPIIGAVQ